MMVGVEGVAAFDANGFARLVKQLGPKGDVVARPAVIDLHAIEPHLSEPGNVLFVSVWAFVPGLHAYAVLEVRSDLETEAVPIVHEGLHA